MSKKTPISKKTIERLSVYRRILENCPVEESVFSHQLAQKCGVSPSQLRRDLMAIGYVGNSAKGYLVGGLVESLGVFLDAGEVQKIVLVGIGHLGRALLDYFAVRRPMLELVAAFDIDPARVDRVIHGVPCFPLEKVAEVAAEKKPTVGILTVPGPVAQDVTDRLVAAGIRGVLSFASVQLNVKPDVFVERTDIATALEKVAFFTRKNEETR